MVAGPGRKCVIKKAGTAIAGVRVSGIAIDNTPIDITDNDSVGIQQLDTVEAFRVLTLTVSGVEKDHVLRDKALDPTEGAAVFTDLTFTFGNALTTNDVLSGTFFMSNYKEDFDYKGSAMFSASFTSSGAWTRT